MNLRGLDFEMGFIDSFEDIMAVEARFMKYMFDYLKTNYSPELKELGWSFLKFLTFRSLSLWR